MPKFVNATDCSARSLEIYNEAQTAPLITPAAICNGVWHLLFQRDQPISNISWIAIIFSNNFDERIFKSRYNDYPW